MVRMIRKQVYIDDRRQALLKRKARELGVSEAELIRRGIDLATSGAEAGYVDLSAWEEMKDFLEKRRRMKVPQTGRSWTREELYDDRLKRISR